MNRVEVNGLRIAYERAGDGPPILLLPGYVGDARGTFGPQLDALAESFTVVAWDTPGSGRSDDPPESFRLSDFADCLAGFTGALGLGTAHVLGLSFGGGLALEFYRRHPEVPRSLILAGAYAGWAGSLRPEEVEMRLQQVLRLADLPPETFVGTVLSSMFSPSASREVVDAFAANVARFHPAGLRTMARAIAEADLRESLAHIEVATLLLYGGADVRAPLGVAQAMHAAIAGSKLVVLHGVGHVSTLESSERFNVEVRNFLDELHD
jgi:pimeloyl-ACP methyl ester carboxylesterase